MLISGVFSLCNSLLCRTWLPKFQVPQIPVSVPCLDSPSWHCGPEAASRQKAGAVVGTSYLFPLSLLNVLCSVSGSSGFVQLSSCSQQKGRSGASYSVLAGGY